MHRQLQSTICIYVFLYFQPIAQSYRVYQLDPSTDKELMPRLKQLLQDQRNEADYQNLKNLIDVRSVRKPLGKSMYVKRIIPHGYQGAEYEYDSNLKTVFKPLVRYHVKKPIAQHEKEIVQELVKSEDTNRKGRSGKNDALIVLVDNDRRNPKDLLRQIKKYINQNNGKRKLKKRFRGLLSRLKAELPSLLRSVLLDKSGEKIDPLAPGKKPGFLIKPNMPNYQPTKKPKVILPEYPIWNYWTYQKTVYQDECPGNLVKIGNMCIGSLGHRKYNMEPGEKVKNSISTRKSLDEKK